MPARECQTHVCPRAQRDTSTLRETVTCPLNCYRELENSPVVERKVTIDAHTASPAVHPITRGTSEMCRAIGETEKTKLARPCLGRANTRRVISRVKRATGGELSFLTHSLLHIRLLSVRSTHRHPLNSD